MLENRNCNCGYNNNSGLDNLNCNYSPDGINAAFGYNSANELNNSNCNNSNCPEECCEERERIRREMIEQIKCLKFAIVDISLYLDTHVDDQKALCLHRKYCNELRELEDNYQRVYGPLTINFPCNKWRWIEEPWPWERGNF